MYSSNFAYQVDNTNINDPSPTLNSNHGNACAGIIAATQDNNEGISGIAPNCMIMPIRIAVSENQFATNAQVINAIRFAVFHGADILSNSWGFNGINPPNYIPAMVTAIQYAVTSGRGGKGCVVVFAAGNTAAHSHSNNGYIEFPANVNIAGVLTVGASDRNDYQADYSPTGTGGGSNNQVIDLVAPSHKAYPCYISGETFEMWSIDMPGEAGYNQWHDGLGCDVPPTIGEHLPSSGTNYLCYTGRFGGTSFACPVVAGVASLILSTNPNLHQQDVFNILTSSADKIGGYSYVNGISNETGYGRVNAYKALLATLPTFPITGPNPLCTTGSYMVNNLSSGDTIIWSKSSNINMISAQGSNPCTFQNNGTFTGWIQASIKSSCGTLILPIFNVWLGIPWISPSSTYTNKGSIYNLVPEQSAPQMLVDSSLSAQSINPNTSTTNNACYLWYVTTSMQIQGQSSVTWSKSYSNPSNITWSQNGNDLKFYFWGLNQTATFSINAHNACGSAINNYFDFASINCGSGCTMDYTLSPNPASSTLTIIPLVPPPCGSVLTNPQIQQVTVYDTQGNPKKTFTFGKGTSQVQIDISSLNIGTYILDINDGTNSVRKTFIIQR